MNINKNKIINSITSFLNQHNVSNESYNIIIKEFNTPLDVCIQRDLWRKQNGDIYIGERTIRDTYNRYINYNKQYCNEK